MKSILKDSFRKLRNSSAGLEDIVCVVLVLVMSSVLFSLSDYVMLNGTENGDSKSPSPSKSFHFLELVVLAKHLSLLIM